MANKIKKGNPIEELVKGSMDYTMQLIREAFRAQFPIMEMSDDSRFYIEEIFSDHIIVRDFGMKSELKTDEYYKVVYSKSGDVYTFAARDAWEIVELSYQPQTATPLPLSTEASPQLGETAQIGGKGKRKGQRIEERVNALAVLEEKVDGQPRRIKFEKAMTAGIVNGNHRRYSADVIQAAVAELSGHLHESAGQARAIQLLGEAEHPSDKGGRPNLLETVIKWDEVAFDGKDVTLIGRVLETSKGKDLLTLMEGGVMPGASMRGYGDGKNITEQGEKIFEVKELHITGFDTVLEPSFENSAEFTESNNQTGDEAMNLEELLKLLREHPEAFAGITEAQVKKMSAEQLKGIEDQVRSALGIGAGENIAESLKALRDKAGRFDESQKRSEVETAITESTKALPYGKEGNENFVESVKSANLGDAEAVKVFVEIKRKEYDKIYAKEKLAKMGFREGKTGLQVIGDVLEEETGTPEYARPAFELAERFRKRNGLRTPNLKNPETPNEIYTKMILERFDKIYMRTVDDNQNVGGLLIESQRFQEANLTTDLNLPTSVSRAVFDIVGPTLVGASIFDVGTIDQSPVRLNFKRFTGETGFTATITDEVEAGGAEDTWYALSQGRITPDSVVVTSNPAGTTYIETVDFVIDYAGGRIKFLTAGDIGANDVLVSYVATAIRKGEMAPIERAKVTIDSIIVTAAADRLADQISREAIVFSRSQFGYDAVAETLAALIQETRRIIDQGLLYTAYSAVKSVPNNSTDTWTVDTTQDSLDELVRLMGSAGIIIDDRYYPADYYLASNVNAERLSHWDGYKRDGFPNAILNAAGFAGGVNNKPIFSSTEFPDSLIIVGNRQLVMHRVFQPMIIKGPYPTYAVDGDQTRLVAADQYYTEEFNVTVSPINEKGAFVPVNDAGS